MYIACDIGGTKFRVARSDDLGGRAVLGAPPKFQDPIIEETPANPREGLRLIAETIKNVANGDQIDAMIFGIAGVLNPTHDFLLKSPHLPEWERVPLREFFSREFVGDAIKNSVPKIFIENDTDIVGLGEAVAGAGRGFEIVVYITISTGIGGAKIVNGQFERNRFGFEPGHQILKAETKETWEELASGSAIERRFGLHPCDVARLPAWRDVEDDIAVGLYNSILHWSPDVVVVGGSMARDLDAERLRQGVARLMKIHPQLPEIRIAELGSIGGISGGFAYLRGRG